MECLVKDFDAVEIWWFRGLVNHEHFDDTRSVNRTYASSLWSSDQQRRECLVEDFDAIEIWWLHGLMCELWMVVKQVNHDHFDDTHG